MAIATIDHWQDPIAGLREMRRVARRVVVFTEDFSDPDAAAHSSGESGNESGRFSWLPRE